MFSKTALVQRFGAKDQPFGKAVAAMTADIATLGGSKSWLAELADELLAGIVQCVPYATYHRYVLPELLPVVKGEKAAVDGGAGAGAGATAGAVDGGDADAVGGDLPSSTSASRLPNRVALALVMARKAREAPAGDNSGGLPGPVKALVAPLAVGKTKGFVDAAVASAAAFPRLHAMWAHVLQWFVDAGALAPTTLLASVTTGEELRG